MLFQRCLLMLGGTLLAATTVAAPPPGHPSTDQAARALGLAPTAQLTQEGRVREAIDSNAYTYLRVELADGTQRWVAVPRLPVAIGARIGFGDGAVMQQFYSKKLKQTFSQITFVSAIQVLPE